MRTAPWTLSDVLVVRHAGFPFDMVESLGFSQSLQELLDQTCEDEKLLVQLAGTKSEQQKVREALNKGQAPPTPKSPLANWSEALHTWHTTRERLQMAYAQEYQLLRTHLHSLAKMPMFQEATFLSNPSFYEDVLRSFLAKEIGPASSNSRRVERQIYKYLQRFCAKNETTSFFGPIAYGEVSSDTHDFKLFKHGERERHTTISYWAVRELNHTISRDSTLRLHVPVRLSALFNFSATHVSSPTLETPLPLTIPLDRLIVLLRQQALSFTEAAMALNVSRSHLFTSAVPLLRSGALVLEIPLSTDMGDGLSALIAGVQQMPEGESRNQWIVRLQKLDERRNCFERAELEERRTLLIEMEELFTAWVGKPARRKAGQVYADRLIINEEARSPFSIHIGQRTLEDLAARLSPALELSTVYGASIQNAYKQQMLALLPDDGTEMPFLDYAQRGRPDAEQRSNFSPFPPLPIEDDRQPELCIPPDFVGPLLSGGRYALPDICLSAPTAEAIAAGQIEIVLSRVHHHLMVWGWLAIFFPERQRFETAVMTWLKNEPSAEGLISLEVERRNKGFYAFPGMNLAMTAFIDAEKQKVISPTTVGVSYHASGPILRDAQGKQLQLYLSMADFVSYPPFAALAHPLVLHAPFSNNASETPRIRVGDVIYQRRRWQTNMHSIVKLHEIDLVLDIWRRKRSQQWPRFVFARVTSERKPWLFDMTSPFAYELLRNMVQNDPVVALEEMLPGPDQLWLRDDEGQRYTSELRLQAHRYTETSIRDH